MLTGCQDCGHKFYLQGSDLDNIVSGGGCPSCGSQNLYRTQVPPVESEMAERNMVDPASGVDAGGNPLQEGIYADTDGGWQPRDRRDESFASVRTANQTPWAQAADSWMDTFIDQRNNQPVNPAVRKQIHELAGKHYMNGTVKRESIGNWPEAYRQAWINMKGYTGADDIHAAVTSQAPTDIDMGDAEDYQHPDPWMDNEPGTLTLPKHWGAKLAEFNMMDFNFADEREPTHKFIVDQGGKIYAMPEPVHHEDIADRYKLHELGYPKGLSLGVKYNDGSTDWYQHESGLAPAQMAERLESHFGEPVTIDPSLRATTNEERWGLDTRPRAPSGRPLRELERLYGPASPRAYGKPRDNEGLVRGGSVDRASNMEPYTPWEHLAEAAGGVTAQVTPGPFGIHAGTVKWLQFLDASVEGINVRQDSQEIIRRFGIQNSPEFRNPVTVTVSHPEYLQPAVETIESSAEGFRAPPSLKALAQSIVAGQVPPPPGIPLEAIKVSSTKQAFLPLLGLGAAELLGGADGGAIVSRLMGGALRGTGSQMAKGLLGGGGGQQQAPAAPAAPAQPAPLPPVVTRTADLETPSSVPEIGNHADSPEDVDQKEYNDGEQPEQLGADDQQGGGSDGFSPETLEEFNQLLPRILHYYNLDESAANDPVLKALHEKLETEAPGYLDHQGDDSAVEELIASLRQPHGITAAGIGPATVTGIPQQQPLQQPGVPLQQPTPATSGPCPYCGGVRRADGSCPQCGATAAPQGGAAPGTLPPTGTSHPSIPPTFAAATHQGPANPEQLKAVAEFLIAQNRAEEIPHMIEAPWEYAEELAQIQNKPNDPPTPDESPTPQPAIEEAPPGATMPVPDPSQQIAAAVARFSADSITPRCPSCGSATTGLLNTDGNARCHACGNLWKVEGFKDKLADAHNHSELHAHPAVEGVPSADQEGQRDISQEQDSSLSWQTVAGEPLQVGQEYEMHSENYDVPDIVRITAVKPDAVEFEITGEYDLGHKTEVSREESELEGLTFEPVEAEDKDDAGEDGNDYLNDVAEAPRQNTVPTPSTSTPFTTSVKESDEEFEDRIEELLCPNCTSAHVSSQMSSPTTTMHDCYKCGHFWEEHDEEEQGEADERRSWIMNSGPGEVDSGPAHAYAGLDYVPEQRVAGGRNLHEIAKRDPRYAGRKFTPLEQRGFIDEEGEARNADRLDLEGTHYKVRDDWTGKANGLNAPDEHLVLGL